MPLLARKVDVRMTLFDIQMTPEVRERFMAKIDTSPGRDLCWPWKAGTNGQGYGAFYVHMSDGAEATVAATRVMMFLMEGPFPAHLEVRHMCDNPPCVNPKHLRLGTSADNAHDKVLKGRHLFGERHHKAKLSEQDVLEVTRRAVKGDRYVDIARDYGLTPTAVWQTATGQHWSHLTREVAAIGTRPSRPWRLTAADVAEGRRRVWAGESIKAVARDLGVVYTSMCVAVHGNCKCWEGPIEGVPPIPSKPCTRTNKNN